MKPEPMPVPRPKEMKKSAMFVVRPETMYPRPNISVPSRMVFFGPSFLVKAPNTEGDMQEVTTVTV